MSVRPPGFEAKLEAVLNNKIARYRFIDKSEISKNKCTTTPINQSVPRDQIQNEKPVEVRIVQADKGSLKTARAPSIPIRDVFSKFTKPSDLSQGFPQVKSTVYDESRDVSRKEPPSNSVRPREKTHHASCIPKAQFETTFCTNQNKGNKTGLSEAFGRAQAVVKGLAIFDSNAFGTNSNNISGHVLQSWRPGDSMGDPGSTRRPSNPVSANLQKRFARLQSGPPGSGEQGSLPMPNAQKVMLFPMSSPSKLAAGHPTVSVNMPEAATNATNSPFRMFEGLSLVPSPEEPKRHSPPQKPLLHNEQYMHMFNSQSPKELNETETWLSQARQTRRSFDPPQATNPAPVQASRFVQERPIEFPMPAVVPTQRMNILSQTTNLQPAQASHVTFGATLPWGTDYGSFGNSNKTTGVVTSPLNPMPRNTPVGFSDSRPITGFASAATSMPSVQSLSLPIKPIAAKPNPSTMTVPPALSRVQPTSQNISVQGSLTGGMENWEVEQRQSQAQKDRKILETLGKSSKIVEVSKNILSAPLEKFPGVNTRLYSISNRYGSGYQQFCPPTDSVYNLDNKKKKKGKGKKSQRRTSKKGGKGGKKGGKKGKGVKVKGAKKGGAGGKKSAGKGGKKGGKNKSASPGSESFGSLTSNTEVFEGSLQVVHRLSRISESQVSHMKSTLSTNQNAGSSLETMSSSTVRLLEKQSHGKNTRQLFRTSRSQDHVNSDYAEVSQNRSNRGVGNFSSYLQTRSSSDLDMSLSDALRKSRIGFASELSPYTNGYNNSSYIQDYRNSKRNESSEYARHNKLPVSCHDEEANYRRSAQYRNLDSAVREQFIYGIDTNLKTRRKKDPSVQLLVQDILDNARLIQDLVDNGECVANFRNSEVDFINHTVNHLQQNAETLQRFPLRDRRYVASSPPRCAYSRARSSPTEGSPSTLHLQRDQDKGFDSTSRNVYSLPCGFQYANRRRTVLQPMPMNRRYDNIFNELFLDEGSPYTRPVLADSSCFLRPVRQPPANSFAIRSPHLKKFTYSPHSPVGPPYEYNRLDSCRAECDPYYTFNYGTRKCAEMKANLRGHCCDFICPPARADGLRTSIPRCAFPCAPTECPFRYDYLKSGNRTKFSLDDQQRSEQFNKQPSVSKKRESKGRESTQSKGNEDILASNRTSTCSKRGSKARTSAACADTARKNLTLSADLADELEFNTRSEDKSQKINETTDSFADREQSGISKQGSIPHSSREGSMENIELATKQRDENALDNTASFIKGESSSKNIDVQDGQLNNSSPSRKYSIGNTSYSNIQQRSLSSDCFVSKNSLPKASLDCLHNEIMDINNSSPNFRSDTYIYNNIPRRTKTPRDRYHYGNPSSSGLLDMTSSANMAKLKERLDLDSLDDPETRRKLKKLLSSADSLTRELSDVARFVTQRRFRSENRAFDENSVTYGVIAKPKMPLKPTVEKQNRQFAERQLRNNDQFHKQQPTDRPYENSRLKSNYFHDHSRPKINVYGNFRSRISNDERLGLKQDRNNISRKNVSYDDQENRYTNCGPRDGFKFIYDRSSPTVISSHNPDWPALGPDESSRYDGPKFWQSMSNKPPQCMRSRNPQQKEKESPPNLSRGNKESYNSPTSSGQPSRFKKSPSPKQQYTVPHKEAKQGRKTPPSNTKTKTQPKSLNPEYKSQEGDSRKTGERDQALAGDEKFHVPVQNLFSFAYELVIALCETAIEEIMNDMIPSFKRCRRCNKTRDDMLNGKTSLCDHIASDWEIMHQEALALLEEVGHKVMLQISYDLLQRVSAKSTDKTESYGNLKKAVSGILEYVLLEAAKGNKTKLGQLILDRAASVEGLSAYTKPRQRTNNATVYGTFYDAFQNIRPLELACGASVKCK